MARKKSLSTFGRVYFESCNCSVALHNIRESKIGSKYKCKIHNTGIAYIHKRCVNCGKLIVYKTILQIMNREFCKNSCVKEYQAKTRQALEDDMPDRLVDCVSYRACMDKACKTNLYDIGCSTCQNYQKDNDFMLK
jgi:hypothetical protein